jgi:hypothetical protein
MIHLFVMPVTYAFDVAPGDRDRFVPSITPHLYEARCQYEAEACGIIERAGLKMAEVDPADGMINLRTPGGLFAGCVGKTDTIAELQAHLAASTD